MGNNIVETIIGAVVLAFAAIFLVFAYRTADIGAGGNGLNLIAKFDQVDGLQVGSDVRMSGIKVGTVTSQTLDTESYRAVIGFSINDEIKLPEDSAAKIASESLLGGSYLDLEPGGAEDMLGEGDEVTFTQSSVSLMDLIGQAIFSATSDDDK
ncbi:outer membrane lipid asymmetry maintenance protein MlaD [Sneathiella sp. P13V-1]|uniref:outer membrane lipid asymmetry maintenance protein MlaD n=1 Tax=Sneathiella sp. P13V-1 TaxID=2697366 RepID=UPI00187B3BD2|nr:outer membrane lipid asymmetry maintenance protein MlaD [Sneathiella sp. P13V-1]MBE7637161.1 outer membrane lipid asymmetry maintenance protein MlaD [Sneathiella sp. P13V-1]